MNDDLPILDELGAEYGALVERELRAAADRAVPARREHAPLRRDRRGRSPQARRVARRVPVTVGLLFLLTTTALAARSLVAGEDTPPDTRPAMLGADARAGWSLSAHRHDGRLCLSFVAGGALADACPGAPAPGGVRPLSTVTPERRYVVGAAGPQVDRVVVRADGRTARVRTHPAVDEAAAHRAGTAPGTRWFVAALPARTALSPARVQPVTAGGRASGPAVLDCSLGSDDPACLAAATADAGRPLP